MRPVTLLTDYGTADEFAGVLHGVIARAAPGARVIDITHGIPPQDVLRGALTLAATLPFMPAGVHVAVVDPGVGGPRRAAALRLAEEERVLVGPDNGLLGLAAERFGGVAEAVEISASPFRLEPVSATFHGRDVFAPVAARLAAGAALREAGVPLDAAALVRLEPPRPRVSAGRLAATVAGADTFGNVELLAARADLDAAGLRPGAAIAVEAGGRAVPATVARTFADVARGAALVYEDAVGAITVAVNGGSAAALLGVGRGDEVVVRREVGRDEEPAGVAGEVVVRREVGRDEEPAEVADDGRDAPAARPGEDRP
jgi:S-adenosylmethionine hydrolase